MIGVLPYEFVGDTIFGTKLNYDNPEDVDHKIVNVYETEDAKKHLEKLDEIKIRPPKGTKERWRTAAETMGKSLSQMIVDAVEAELQRLE